MFNSYFRFVTLVPPHKIFYFILREKTGSGSRKLWIFKNKI